MPSIGNETLGSIFNRILQIDQSSNTGIDSSVRSVQSGDGVNSCMKLGTNGARIAPEAADGTATFQVRQNGGNVFGIS